MRLTEALNSLVIEKPKPSAPPFEPKLDRGPMQGMTFPRAMAILRKHRWASLGIFAGIMAAVTLGVFLLPKSYQSESKLFVRVGRESVGLDPTATTGQTISVYESRENEINSVIDVLESRIILETIVEKLAPELAAGPPAQETGEYSKIEFDALVRGLSQSIAVSHSKKSNVITLTAKAKSPELAQKVLKEMLTAFQEQHLKVNSTQGSFAFFQRQKELLEQELFEARQELRDAKNSFGLASVEGQRRSLEEQILETKSALMENERHIAAATAELKALDRFMSELPQEIQAQKVTGFFNDAHEQTREQLHQLEIEYQHLLTKFTDRQANVRAVKQKIDAAQAILRTNGTGNQQQTTSVNPAYQQIAFKQLTEQSRVESLHAEAHALSKQLEKLERLQRELNDNEARLAGLEQTILQRETSFKANSEKFEEARINQELGKEQISNVNIVQPATFLPQPVSPKKRIILACGFLFASLTACGFGFVKELLAEKAVADGAQADARA
jgi:uncharacterized protein involved in exopolysaccharide biosynthesis